MSDPPPESLRAQHQHLLRLKRGPSATAEATVTNILGHGLLFSRRGIARFQDSQGRSWHTTLRSYYGPVGYVVRVRYLIDDPSCNEPETNHPRSLRISLLKVVFVILSLVIALGVGWLMSQ